MNLAPKAILRPAIALFALATALALAVYGRTLTLAFGWDDMDYLDVAADALSGKSPLLETIFRLHQEHLMPVSRVLFHFNLELFGAVTAFPVRLATLLFHALAATGLALVARRLIGPGLAGPAAALAYVVPAGFSSMWLWIPSGGGIPIGLAGIAWASVAAVYQEDLGRRRALHLAGLAMAFALLSENTMVPLLATPWLLWHLVRAQSGGPRKPDIAFTLLCGSLALALVALFAKLYQKTAGGGPPVDLVAGVPRALFLLLSAPFRYLFPGLLLQYQASGDRRVFLSTCAFGVVLLASLGIALLLATRGRRVQLAMLLAVASGPCAWVTVVGIARFKTSLWDLWYQDRYYFPLLLPASFLAALLVDAAARSLRGSERRVALPLALAAVAALVLAHRSALHSRVSFGIFEAHARRIASLSRLVALLDARPGGAATFPDGRLSFPDIHNGRISTRLLLYGLVPHPPHGLTLGSPTSEDEASLNAVLAEWGRREGDGPSQIAIRAGRIEALGAGPIADFRTGGHDVNVISGLHAWEGSWRWISGEGHLRLTLAGSRLSLLVASPSTKILAANPEWKSLVLRLAVLDPATGARVPLEDVTLTGDAPQLVERSLPADFVARYRNAGIELVLSSPTVWRPSAVLPGSTDGRDLSVMLYSAGFGD